MGMHKFLILLSTNQWLNIHVSWDLFLMVHKLPLVIGMVVGLECQFVTESVSIIVVFNRVVTSFLVQG